MRTYLYGPIDTGAAAGGAGVATSNVTTTTRLAGLVYGIYVKYNGTPPGTTDVTVKTLGTSPAAPSYNLLVITNAATDGWFYPRELIHTTAGAQVAGEYTPLIIDDFLNVAIAQANNDDTATFWFLLGAA